MTGLIENEMINTNSKNNSKLFKKALEDFTGGVTEMYELKEAPRNLFEIISKGFEST